MGLLLSDGCINKPKYRKKGDETHLEFICKYSDREVLYKIKDILHTKAKVHDYPDYKSPQSKIRIYDRKDIIERYYDIKTIIPEDIEGYERHFIRGLIDGDGCLYYREKRKSFLIIFVDEYEHIVRWVADTICDALMLPKKNIRHIEKDHIYEIRWEGTIAQLIAYWLYHGDVEHCSLQRKLQKMYDCILNGNKSLTIDQGYIYAAKAYLDNNEIAFPTNAIRTLDWCHRLQKLLSFNTVPVFHNKGKRKYYRLYIPKNQIVNTQSA